MKNELSLLVNPIQNNNIDCESVEMRTELKIAVEVQNVVFAYKKNKAIHNNLNVQIPQGKIYALLGPNGCGKTTLLRLVLGRLKPKSGCIRVFGEEPNSKNSEIPGPGVGYMPQEIALFNELTIEEILCYFGTIYHMNRDLIEKRIQHLTDLLRLPKKDRKISELSGGQQRLVSIAVTMIHRPPLLILDEPTVGVDSLLRCQIWKYLDNISKYEGITVLIITHYIEEARNASIVGFMRSGSLLTQSNPNELMDKYNSETLEDVFFKLCQQISDKNELKNNDQNSENIIISSIRSHHQFGKKRKFINSVNMKALFRKSFIRVKRNPLLLFLFYSIPIIQIILSHLCIGSKPHSLPVAIFNAESEPDVSQLFISKIDNKYIHNRIYNSNESAINSVSKGENWFAISFSQNFSDSFENRILNPNELKEEELNNSRIELYVDMSNSVIGNYINQYLLESFQNFLLNFSSTLGYNPIAFTMPLTIEKPIYGSSESTFRDLYTPGVMVAVLHLLPMILAAFLLVIERRDGHLERSFVAGIKPIEILLTHIIILFIAISTQILLSMFVAFEIIGIEIKGSVLDVFVLLLTLGLQGMSYGFIVALVFSDEAFALMAIFATIFPLWFTSGMVWPLESLNLTIRNILYLNPLSFPIESLRSVMLRGWSFTNTNVMIGYAVSSIYTLIFLLIDISMFERFSVQTLTSTFFKN